MKEEKSYAEEQLIRIAIFCRIQLTGAVWIVKLPTKGNAKGVLSKCLRENGVKYIKLFFLVKLLAQE